MSEIEDLLKEALWALGEGKDVENARFCAARACVMLGSPSTETSVKRKSKKTKKKSRKKKKKLNLLIVGKLPHCLSSDAFRAAVTPMLEDVITGDVMYKGFLRMNNGTYCYNFDGMCPVHLRNHTNVGPWQLKQHKKSEWCGWKCWKEDGYVKLFSNPVLCSF